MTAKPVEFLEEASAEYEAAIDWCHAVIDPEVWDVFPDGPTVNRTLRALASVLRLQHGPVTKRRTG